MNMCVIFAAVTHSTLGSLCIIYEQPQPKTPFYGKDYIVERESVILESGLLMRVVGWWWYSSEYLLKQRGWFAWSKVFATKAEEDSCLGRREVAARSETSSPFHGLSLFNKERLLPSTTCHPLTLPLLSSKDLLIYLSLPHLLLFLTRSQ
jgi:hypothetical protein